MGALGHLSKGRHVAVGLAVLGSSALALFGVTGDGNPEEKVDSWQTVVEPAGGDAVRVTETIDWDFGDSSRHGIFRDIPNDFGTPTHVRAASPDAPDDVAVDDAGGPPPPTKNSAHPHHHTRRAH